MDRPLNAYFPLLFAFLLWGVLFGLRKISGWPKLLEYYRLSKPFSGNIWRVNKGSMNGVIGLYDIGVDAVGLYVSGSFPFKYLEPPLLIPWTDVKYIQSDAFLGKHTEFTFKKTPNITFKISKSFAGINSITAKAMGASVKD